MHKGKRPVVYISGLYSGPNPSPGVGIARSLRAAYPDATLIGIDYSNRSSGLHWSDFDEIWLQRPWDELDLKEYVAQIRQMLNDGALWISGLDLETIWLAYEIGEHPNLLIPPFHALDQVRKPAIPASQNIPVKIPPFTLTSAPEYDLYAFCRKHGWPVWVKGPWYQAHLARNWREVKATCAVLSETWSTSTLFLQKHVVGQEESIAFSAYRGKLLDAVYMEKRDITSEGKTWAGHVSQVPSHLLNPLRSVIRYLEWTGGAELEMVRDSEGDLWLIEWNARFPAWIHGATIAGYNLPALLVERATGIPYVASEPQSADFTRVVLEVPTRPRYPLPPLPEPHAGQSILILKHPSGMPTLAKRLRNITANIMITKPALETIELVKQNDESDTTLWNLIRAEINRINLKPGAKLDDTPKWLFFESVAHFLFERMARVSNQTTVPIIKTAYSVKTNPDARFLDLARRFGFLAETISQKEIDKAISLRFSIEQIVLNGPGKWWPERRRRHSPLHALFCDSIEEIEYVFKTVQSDYPLSQIIGVRIRPPQISSRFGVPVDSFEAFRKLVQLVKILPPGYKLGIHFHIPSSEIGLQAWWRLFDSMLNWGKAIEAASGRKIQVVDIGGGFFPEDLQMEIQTRISHLKKRALRALPGLEEIILEPGKALVQPAMGLATRVLEIRRSATGSTEVVVDGSIAELPDIWYYPHRIVWLRPEKSWKLLGQPGTSRIMGRLCMEGDILAENIRLPERIKEGDFLIFLDSGSYDRSMSYAFGRG